MSKTRCILITILVSLLVVGLSAGCAMRQKKELKELGEAGPVDCSTANGDLRLLHHEKANVAERVAEGVTAIYPASLVMSVLTGTERTKLKVAIGEYDKAIDKRIAQIKETCGIE
jgi:hypothetical protein